MRLQATAICGATAAVLLCAIAISSLGGAADAASPKVRTVATDKPATSARVSSVVQLPERQSTPIPNSVTLSPNGRWLAVCTESSVVHVKDLQTDKWITSLDGPEDASSPLRWHPSQPVLVFSGGSAKRPRYYMGWPLVRKVRPLFRSGWNPFIWTGAGLVDQWGIWDLARSGENGGKRRSVGYAIPWDLGEDASVEHMASGPHDEVAVEFAKSNVRERRWLETYRRVPGRMQWIHVAQVTSSKDEGYVSINPSFLGNGELTYLKMSRAPAEIGPPSFGLRPGVYELWASSLDGKKRRRLAVIPDLGPYGGPSEDWYAVDWPRKTVYYLSGDNLRQMKL